MRRLRRQRVPVRAQQQRVPVPQRPVHRRPAQQQPVRQQQRVQRQLCKRGGNMAKILLNPEAPKGAPIKEYTVRVSGNSIVSFPKDKPFQPGSLFQFDDDEEGQAYLDNFQFLEELTPEEAKKFLSMEKHRCDQCDYQAYSKAEVDRHIKAHGVSHELSDLGIPVIKKQQNMAQLNSSVEDLQKQIDAQDKADGLEGAGIIDDKPIKTVVMSGGR